MWSSAIRQVALRRYESVFDDELSTSSGRERLGLVGKVRENSLAWQRGLLVADDIPLQQWAQPLMRYSDRRLACDPALSELRVSGTFPVDDLPLALAMLAQTYGLQVREGGGRLVISR